MKDNKNTLSEATKDAFHYIKSTLCAIMNASDSLEDKHGESVETSVIKCAVQDTSTLIDNIELINNISLDIEEILICKVLENICLQHNITYQLKTEDVSEVNLFTMPAILKQIIINSTYILGARDISLSLSIKPIVINIHTLHNIPDIEYSIYYKLNQYLAKLLQAKFTINATSCRATVVELYF
jgi:hypothetical protein